MAITASMVKELREITGVGMMDCKNALKETDGDIESAIDWLRKKGLAKAAKKSGRVAAEGLVAVNASGTSAVVVEVNSETDFVALNPEFQSLVDNVAKIALTNNGEDAAIEEAAYLDTGKTVKEYITSLVASIGENMSFRRASALKVDSGIVATYMHNSVVAGVSGKLGVLVALESTGDAGKLDALGKQIAMHIAATNPASLDVSDLDPAIVEREKNILVETARASGKPDNIIEKMIEGRMRKYYQEVVLLQQTFVIDGENTVEKAIQMAAKDIGADVKLIGFIRMELGEGIEKKVEDFAAEVAAASGQA
ncbi:MAG: elongation factor Ts [Rhizobiales bacterium]|nr:elongation factor Ts [Hyphomicrobiales bacterium]